MIAEHEKLVYSSDQLEEVRAKMKESGETNHTLFEMPAAVNAFWKRRRLFLYCVNFPAMVAIPLFLELADLQAIYAERADFIMTMLSSIDMAFLIISFSTFY